MRGAIEFRSPGKGILGECSLPSYLQRAITTRAAAPETRTAACKSDVLARLRHRDCRVGERLEFSPRRPSALARPMVLLNVVEILAAAPLHVFLLWILPSQ